MDELDMMSLELPSTEGLDDLEHPERSGGDAESGSDAENGASASGSSEHDEDYSYEYEGGELEDMAVPTLSEMDGSELGTPAANAKAASFDKPEAVGNDSAGTVGLSEMSGAPAFSEMSGAPAGGQTGQYGGQGMNGQYSSNAPGNNFGNNANNSAYNSPNNMQNQQGGYGRQNTYAPVNPGSANGGGMSQSGGSSYWDNLERDNELVKRGETVAKRVATAVIVLAGLSVLSNLANKDILGAASAAVDIYLAVKFMQGSHSCRFWLGIFCVINFITSIRSVILIKNISDLAAALGAEVHGLGFFSLYFLIAAVGMLVLAYFFFFNKAIDAYCERYSDRVE